MNLMVGKGLSDMVNYIKERFLYLGEGGSREEQE